MEMQLWAFQVLLNVADVQLKQKKKTWRGWIKGATDFPRGEKRRTTNSNIAFSQRIFKLYLQLGAMFQISLLTY